jgi:SOS-response transcriptional repressor LexA
MNEKQTVASNTLRPTKKQRELLSFIDAFIKEHGYSPSYREIMTGLHYTSVATVSLHVGNLIKRGHLRKRENSARSLEVVDPDAAATVTTNQVRPAEEKWLVGKVEHAFTQAESGGEVEEHVVADLVTLLAALRVLELEEAASSFVPRITEIKKRIAPPSVA